jgi:replicative superfamily II helicase
LERARRELIIDNVSLFIIAESHILHDGGGAFLEAIIARTMRTALATGRCIRLRGFYALMSNSEDIAAFIEVTPDFPCSHSEELRKVPSPKTSI